LLIGVKRPGAARRMLDFFAPAAQGTPMDTAVKPAPELATLAPQSITTEVLQEKYCQTELGETSAEQVFARVAQAVAAVEPTPELRAEMAERFRLNMRAGAIGAGRIMASAGAGHNATFINCFVQPVGDAAVGYDEDGRPASTPRWPRPAKPCAGGGVGYNFSAIRPRARWSRARTRTPPAPAPSWTCSTPPAAP
jgi:ribonucleoside-diphosphate reductase alpha chain